MKRTLAIICALVLALTCLITGCGKNNSVDDNEISVAIYAPEVASSEGTAESNRWTKYIEENTGLKIKWIAIPQSDMDTKMNTLLAAGEAPDMFVNWSNEYMQGLVNEDMLMPLDDLIKNGTGEYKKYIEENPELDFWTKMNGQTYAFTQKRSPDLVANYGIWIRQDWLDKLGLETPTTVDELLDVARAFKTLGDDIIPIANVYDAQPLFFNAHYTWYVTDDGNGLEYGLVTDRFMDSVEFMKTCYDEGLIYKEYFVDKGGTKRLESWKNGKSGILFKQWLEVDQEALLKNDPTANPVPLKAIASDYCHNGYPTAMPPYYYVMVNKDAQNPQACMKLIDWLVGGGWKSLKFGEEGVHYKMDGEVPVSICTPDVQKTEVSYAVRYMLAGQYNIEPSWITKMAAPDEMSQRLAALKAKSLETVSQVPFRRDLPYNPPIERISTVVSDFQANYGTAVVKTITGGDEYTLDWCSDQIQQEWKRVGGEEADKLADEWYSENKDFVKEFRRIQGEQESKIRQ